MNRAVRFIRYHAKDYTIDPDRIGITGGSAGGHLSLMQGTAGDAGDPKAKDPVDRTSSRVQAVACFFPPTDFLNWGEKGKEMLSRDCPATVHAATRLPRVRQGRSACSCRSPMRRKRWRSARQISPITTSPRTIAADADHPRRQGRFGAVAAVGSDHREVQGSRRAGRAGRQEGRRPRLATMPKATSKRSPTGSTSTCGRSLSSISCS